MNVAAQPVQLGDDDRRLTLLGNLQRGGQLWPALQGVRALNGAMSSST